MGEGRAGAAWAGAGGAPSGGTGAIACAVAQVATQCSFALEPAFCCAAERHKEKLNNQTVGFMVLLAEVPVEEMGNHIVDLTGFG